MFKLSTCYIKKFYFYLILLETDWFDFQLCSQVFSNYKIFFQKRENANSGVVILVRNDLKTDRIRCELLHLCIVDILEDVLVTVVGICMHQRASRGVERIYHLLKFLRVLSLLPSILILKKIRVKSTA
jgi:hypothetical protein